MYDLFERMSVIFEVRLTYNICNIVIFVFQMTHVFKDYGPGARFIRFTHGGSDTQFWAGWYGIRVTNST